MGRNCLVPEPIPRYRDILAQIEGAQAFINGAWYKIGFRDMVFVWKNEWVRCFAYSTQEVKRVIRDNRYV